MKKKSARKNQPEEKPEEDIKSPIVNDEDEDIDPKKIIKPIGEEEEEETVLGAGPVPDEDAEFGDDDKEDEEESYNPFDDYKDSER